MTIDDVMLRVAAALRKAEIPFMVVGGFSSNYYGIVRSTQDADFVVQLSAPLSAKFAETLGPDFEPEAQLSFETKTCTQRQEFRVAGTLFKVGVSAVRRPARSGAISTTTARSSAGPRGVYAHG
jgi:hypothetical protein